MTTNGVSDFSHEWADEPQALNRAEDYMGCAIQAYGTRMCATCWRAAREALDVEELRRLVALYPPALAALHYLNDENTMKYLYGES